MCKFTSKMHQNTFVDLLGELMCSPNPQVAVERTSKRKRRGKGGGEEREDIGETEGQKGKNDLHFTLF